MIKPTEKMIEAFYDAHDASLECQPREHHQAVLEGLSTALAVEAGTVGVKPLEWGEGAPGTYTEVAESPFGHYSVWEINGTACWSPWKQGYGSIVEGGLAGAKAAAQSDYEARILSALTTSPASSGVEGEAVAWQPIETAPKDGSWIEVWDDDADGHFHPKVTVRQYRKGAGERDPYDFYDHLACRSPSARYTHYRVPAAPSLSAGAGGEERG